MKFQFFYTSIHFKSHLAFPLLVDPSVGPSQASCSAFTLLQRVFIKLLPQKIGIPNTASVSVTQPQVRIFNVSILFSTLNYVLTAKQGQWGQEVAPCGLFTDRPTNWHSQLNRCFGSRNHKCNKDGRFFNSFELGMWKRSILVPLPPLPLPLPLPFCKSNTSSYPILQNGSGQSLPHP